MTLAVLDLFSGIGGFSLGLERAGMRTVAFCEIEPYPQAVLRKHWPEVPIYDDVRTLSAARLAADGIGRIDVICGGFPCQDISKAGKGAGLAGERSGLWSEIARLVGELRPRYVIVENVSALLGRGLGDVLGDLAALGYDAEWECIPAAAVGAPHLRDRVWIVAYPNADGQRFEQGGGEFPQLHLREPEPRSLARELRRDVPDADGDALRHEPERAASGRHDLQAGGQAEPRHDGAEGNVADADRAGRQEQHAAAEPAPAPARLCAWGLDASRDDWGVEPDVGRVADGVPSRVDRLAALGNAVVPQIPEAIGRAILAFERALTDAPTTPAAATVASTDGGTPAAAKAASDPQ